jgi:hypothetical protein
MLAPKLPSLPEYFDVSPKTLTCPRCKAEPGEACVKLKNLIELIHLERIEAAAEIDRAAKRLHTQ